MARPRKLEAEGETKIMAEEYLPEVKFVIIPIAIAPTDSGAVGVRQADAVASDWVRKGYKLLSVERGEYVAGDRASIICTFVKV